MSTFFSGWVQEQQRNLIVHFYIPSYSLNNTRTRAVNITSQNYLSILPKGHELCKLKKDLQKHNIIPLTLHGSCTLLTTCSHFFFQLLFITSPLQANKQGTEEKELIYRRWTCCAIKVCRVHLSNFNALNIESNTYINKLRTQKFKEYKKTSASDSKSKKNFISTNTPSIQKILVHSLHSCSGNYTHSYELFYKTTCNPKLHRKTNKAVFEISAKTEL